MRKVIIGFAFFLILGVAAYLRFYRPKHAAEFAYAGNREVTLYSTTAQVREPVTTVSFGERLDVLDRFQDEVEVRAKNGAKGWVDEHELLSSELWEQARQLAIKAASMPVEARGHTRVLSNLHVEPGREAARIRQLEKNVPLLLLARQPVEVPTSDRPDAEQENPSSAAENKKEDWWLVVARPPDQETVVGWLLARFVELDVPAPLPDYASAAGTRIVAWFELNHVADRAGGQKPQYLLVGARGPEGQACDFTQMRVYTYSAKHNRYETAFVDSGLCGRLPVDITRSAAPATDIVFSFQDLRKITPEQRVYRMRETIVRRVRLGESPKPLNLARH